MRRRLRIAGVCLAMASGLFMSGGVTTAAPQRDDMKTRHEDTMARQQDMMTRMTMLDSRIAMLAEQMNSSAGEAKVTAMAALLSAMVEQQRTMRSGMMEMCSMAKSATPPATSQHHPVN